MIYIYIYKYVYIYTYILGWDLGSTTPEPINQRCGFCFTAVGQKARSRLEGAEKTFAALVVG